MFSTESLNRELYDFCLNSGGLALKAADSPDAKTAAAINFCVDGVFYQLAITATVDLSATTYATGGSLVIADDETADVLCMVNAAGTVTTHLVRSDETYEPDAGVLVFGKIIILNETGSDFTVGTTALDVSGVTDTYVNYCRFPGYVGRSTSTGTTTY